MNVATQQLPYVHRSAHAGPTAVRSRMPSTGGHEQGMPSNGSHQSLSSSHYSSYSNQSLRSSDSTQLTSASTLFSTPPPPLPTPTPKNGGPIEATDNVLNKRGEKDQSLFQICLGLRQRLERVPGFAEVLEKEDQESDADMDPVSLLWNLFRRGYPLLIIFNSLGPATPLEVDPTKVNEKKRAKTATIKFLQACQTELKIPSDRLFIVTDLFGADTTGFVKVSRVINSVLDILVDAGVLDESVSNETTTTEGGNTKRTQRQHIIQEMVHTERTYVQHLELLQAFKRQVEEKGLISGDAVFDIFLNLNALLDFQRRFLIRVEQTNATPEADQNWGNLFMMYKDAFRVYEDYIANQKRCEETAMREFDKLKMIDGPPELRQMVESPTVLSSFLLKPFQRLSKYPLLLQQLRDKGDLDEQRKADLNLGIEAASSVLQRTNAAVDREERNEAVEDLKSRVDDWKGHRLDGFGDLLLYGTYTVLKSDSVKRDSEREYKIYLFEMILLCCKELDPSKQKNKIMNRPMVDKRGKPKLQLKGRIFMQNVTETISFSKQGSYTCQIFWKGDPGIENFIIRFNGEDVMKKFTTFVDQQRRLMKETTRGSNTTTTNNIQFTYLQGMTPTENPYKQDNDDEDNDDDDTDTIGSYRNPSEISLPRSDSNLSLRSRSGTIERDPRLPPPRFPMQPPLTLRTQALQQQQGSAISPLGGPQDSYFSPSAESPISTRTSSSSGPFPFPRQQTPNGWYQGEESNNTRYTAPAMARVSSREAPGMAGYPAGRNPQRPSLPASAAYSSASQNRLRSASSPDIQNPLAPGTRRVQGHPPIPDVPVPPFPTHYAYAPSISRSQNGSPANMMDGSMPHPARTSSQSPHLSRDGTPSRQHDYPPSNARYEHQPRQSSLHRAAMSNDSGRTMLPPPGEVRTASPPMPVPTPVMEDMPIPSQLKVKVHCPSANSTMTLVVPGNISYASLRDRIDAKLQRTTSFSLASGQFKLKYMDEDDLVVIQNDEDVQTAFETWKEQQREQLFNGHMGEIDLFCQK